jgi:hypothetical protein
LVSAAICKKSWYAGFRFQHNDTGLVNHGSAPEGANPEAANPNSSGMSVVLRRGEYREI